MAQFTSAGGGGVPTTGSLSSEIVSYSVVNESVPTSNTEVEITVPTTAVWIHIYNRTEGLTKIAFNATESGTLYSTLPPGATNEYNKKSGVAMSLYVQCPGASQVIEVTYGHSA